MRCIRASSSRFGHRHILILLVVMVSLLVQFTAAVVSTRVLELEVDFKVPPPMILAVDVASLLLWVVVETLLLLRFNKKWAPTNTFVISVAGANRCRYRC